MSSEKQFLKDTLIDPDALTYEDRAFLAAIQVLRLEFYEIFSRFSTESDGKAFTPVSINYDPVVE